MSGTEEVEEAETIDTQDSWRTEYGRPKTQPWISIPSLFFAMCISVLPMKRWSLITFSLKMGWYRDQFQSKQQEGNDTVPGLRLSLKKLASFHSVSLKPDQLPCENCQLEHKSPHWTEVSCQKWTSLRWARQPNSWSQVHEWDQLDQYKHSAKANPYC